MEAAAIAALFSTIRMAISFASEQLELSKAKGDITDEQYQAILAESVRSQADWDAEQAAARARIAARNGG